MKNVILSAFILFIFIVPAFAQPGNDVPLRSRIEELAKPIKGIVGVSILNPETGDTLSYNGSARLVLHSVMKFPIALTVMHLVDSGVFTLNQLMHIPKRDMVKDTYSPMRDKYPKGADLPLSEIIKYMVAESDNNACDFLLKTIGGAKTVQDYMLHIGIKGIAIRASEADMASMWELQYTNWCKPVEMTMLLDQFYRGKILAKPTTDTLYHIMTETTTGPNRLKGLLPAGTVVAHKTGTSPTNAEGLSPATNDVGIITLPNGKHLIISVFVCNSTDDEATREGVIAKIGKAAFDYYSR
ncbi:class A beta-lactamase, subclass A2 [Mucilaginibacter sp.]|uniref:class A beta-lactamase, subclass A2 n=1 Tax=Mucilaginibacter sp. TaxID=1882438 RepID=UPI002848AA22|nr:class A beta-lactamase, subclass A2 [Mucilaginibacter sp.]MDR3694458.1 class A beta-lactamase, subclass A2 [Mucilaginibacter sp.]